MSGVAIALITFAGIIVGAALGVFLRRVLPEHHLSTDSKDVMKLAMGLIATMAALVLGLLIASAKSSYDTDRKGLDQLSANIVLLDRMLVYYGADAKGARDALRNAVAYAVERMDSGFRPLESAGTTAHAGTVYETIAGLSPKSDEQRELKSQALQVAQSLGQTRWLFIAEQQSASIPMLFLAVLIFWLAILFAGFGLFAPPNWTVFITLFVCALSVSGAIFLILELDRPFGGPIHISSAPLHIALEHLEQ